MSGSHFLNEFFNPRIVAIIGARHTPGFGFQLPLSLKKHGHGEKVRLVNPRGGTLHGMPLYKSVRDIAEKIDLAVVITPAAAVPDVLIELGDAGIKNIVLESAGFAEIGDDGRQLQNKCRDIAIEKGLRVMGPNCVGVVNTENKFFTGEVIEAALKQGNIGLVAQSGIFGSILLDHFPSKGLAISRGVTLGNRLIVDESDALEYFRDDESTRVVLMYLEGAADGKKLRSALGRITPVKPVIVLKSGRTAEGGAATGSHTGSMAGADEIYNGLFMQTGAIRASGVSEMLDLAQIFSQQPLPRGNRICVLTTSGSMGAVSIDKAVNEGLAAAKLSDETVSKIKTNAPAWMNVKNPLDVGPSGIFRQAFEAALTDPGVDMLLMFPAIPYAVIENFGALGINAGSWLGPLGQLRKSFPDKPVAAGIVGHPDWNRQLRELCGADISLIEYPENAVYALAALTRYAQFRNRANAQFTK